MGTEGQPLVNDSLKKARAGADQELAAFRRSGFQRGEGAMLLSVAEVCLESRSVEDRRAGLKPAKEAQALLQQAGDKKLEATSWLVLAALHSEDRERKKAMDAADRALELSQAAEDRVGEAWALHAAGIAHYMEGSYAECAAGLDLVEDAAELFGEIGCLRLKGFEMITSAQMLMHLDRPKPAVMAAKEALLALRKAGYGRGSEAVAIGTHVQTLVEQDQPNQALQIAKEGLAKFRKAGDRRQELVMQDVLARVYMEKDEGDEALEAAKAGMALCQELQDAELEADLLLTMSEAYTKMGKLDDALLAAQDSSTIFRALDDSWSYAAMAQFQVAYGYSMLGEFKHALEEAQLGRDFFYKGNDTVGEGVALMQVASIQAAEGSIDDALATVKEGRDLYESVHEKSWEAYSFYIQAEILKETKDFDSALQAAEERRKITQDLGYRKEEAKAMHSIASIYLRRRNATQAATAREGLRLARAVGDRIVEVHMLLVLVQANIHLLNDGGGFDKLPKLGEETLKLSRESVALARKVNHGKLRPHALFWNAHVLNMSPYAVEAMEVAEEAQRLFKAAGDKLGEAHAQLLQAQVFFVRKKSDKAKEFAREALEMFTTLDDRHGIDLTTSVLAQIAPARIALAPDGGYMDFPTAEQALPVVPAMVSVVEEKKGLVPAEVRAQITMLAVDVIGEDTDLTMDSPLMDMGMDSLSSVSLRNDMARRFQVPLSASVMFDYPTINELANLILSKAE